jgi:putative glycosyltransferase (TIGR04372 family)
MGREVEAKFPINDSAFIDYAVSPFRSDFLDVFLYSKAQLAIAGSVSGIDNLAFSFGVPYVATNFIPFEDPRWATAEAIVLPALYRSEDSKNLMPLSQMLGHRYGKTQEFRDSATTVIHNDPQDISRVIIEMMSRLDGTWSETAGALAAQNKFWDWAVECGIDEAIPEGPWQQSFTRARLGSDFLDKYHEIMMS